MYELDPAPGQIEFMGCATSSPAAWRETPEEMELRRAREEAMPMTTTGLFAGSRIEARYNTGTPMEVIRSKCWYPGIVKRVHGGGASYDVRFDDGVNEDGIPAEHIRKKGSGKGGDVLPGLGGPDMPAPVQQQAG